MNQANLTFDARLHSIEAIKSANRAAGGHFFDPGAMRFFSSRISPGIYHTGDHINLFITSERYDSRSARRYTIRQLQADGGIETVGEFQQYASLRAARAAITSGRAFAAISA